MKSLCFYSQKSPTLNLNPRLNAQITAIKGGLQPSYEENGIKFYKRDAFKDKKAVPLKLCQNDAIIISPKSPQDLAQVFPRNRFCSPTKTTVHLLALFKSQKKLSFGDNKTKFALACGKNGYVRLELYVSSGPSAQIKLIATKTSPVYAPKTEVEKECALQHSQKIQNELNLQHKDFSLQHSLKLRPGKTAKSVVSMPYTPSICILQTSEHLPYPEDLLTENEKIYLIKNMIDSLNFFEEKQLLHGDLKSDNIFFNPQTDTLYFGDLDFLRTAEQKDTECFNPTEEISESLRSPYQLLKKPDPYFTYRDRFAIALSIIRLTNFQEFKLIMDIHLFYIRHLIPDLTKLEESLALEDLEQLSTSIFFFKYEGIRINQEKESVMQHCYEKLEKIKNSWNENKNMVPQNKKEMLQHFKREDFFDFKSYAELLRKIIQRFAKDDKTQSTNISAVMKYLLFDHQAMSQFKWPEESIIPQQCPTSLYEKMQISPTLLAFLKQKDPNQMPSAAYTSVEAV